MRRAGTLRFPRPLCGILAAGRACAFQGGDWQKNSADPKIGACAQLAGRLALGAQ